MGGSQLKEMKARLGPSCLVTSGPFEREPKKAGGRDLSTGPEAQLELSGQGVP
jgi:hypothetical protein